MYDLSFSFKGWAGLCSVGRLGWQLNLLLMGRGERLLLVSMGPLKSFTRGRMG